MASKERSVLTALARRSLLHYLKNRTMLPPPQELTAAMKGRAGVFVSLKKNGELRGCIGTFLPARQNIAEEIIYNAVAAGLEDPRFPPVQLSEMAELCISVDVLGEPEPAPDPSYLDVQRYGVIVSHQGRRGLLLPMLEGVETVEEQLAVAKRKAGIPAAANPKLYRFTVTRYK